MDDTFRKFIEKTLIFVSLLLYISSLINLGFTSPENRFFGWEILLTGGFQTMVGFSGFAATINEMSIQISATYLLLTLPWLANVTMILTIVCYFYGTKICRLFAMASVVFVGMFFISPKAIIGSGISITDVQPQIGAYLWALTAISLLIAGVIKKYG